ncbi:hypothetical protein M3Y99_01027900 [Aphelenchoides fujianensis]|nr:hypothetical protein M3Y99_01027900 [Aphelenchoides fujianensis]
MTTVWRNVEQCGLFVEDHRLHHVMYNWEQFMPRLDEEFVKRGAPEPRIQLGRGSKVWKEVPKNSNELHGLAAFLLRRMWKSKPKLGLKAAAHNADIVSRRNLLTRIACSPFMWECDYDPGFSISACRVDGVVFLHEIFTVRPTPTTPEERKKERQVRYQRKKKAYVRAKLDEVVTTVNGKKKDVTRVASAAHCWTLVTKCELKSGSNRKRAPPSVGQHGECNGRRFREKCVQIIPFAAYTAAKDGEQLAAFHTFPNWQLRFFLHGLFSGQERVIGGVYHRRSKELLQIVEMNSNDWLRKADGWNLEECLAYLYDIRKAVDAQPEGTLVHVERKKRQKTLAVRVVPPAERRAFEFLSPEFRCAARPPPPDSAADVLERVARLEHLAALHDHQSEPISGAWQRPFVPQHDHKPQSWWSLHAS